MMVSVRGVSIAPELTAQDVAPIAMSSTSVEMPAEFPAATVISLAEVVAKRAFTVFVVAGKTAEGATSPTRQMSTVTTRLFNACGPRNVAGADNQLTGREW